MDIKNFKKITENHFIIVELIKERKNCESVKCEKCPFTYENATNGKYCFINGYKDFKKQNLLLKSCDNFLKFKGVAN